MRRGKWYNYQLGDAPGLVLLVRLSNDIERSAKIAAGYTRLADGSKSETKNSHQLRGLYDN